MIDDPQINVDETAAQDTGSDTQQSEALAHIQDYEQGHIRMDIRL